MMMPIIVSLLLDQGRCRYSGGPISRRVTNALVPADGEVADERMEAATAAYLVIPDWIRDP